MNKYYLKYLIILFLFGILGCSSENKTDPEVKNGIIDFSPYNIEKTFTLNGEWLFFPKELINSSKEAKEIEAKKIQVPGRMNNFFLDNNNPKGFGYGTYQLIIKGLEPQKNYAIKLNTVGTSVRVFADGKKIANSGKVGKNKDAYIPYYKPQMVEFEATADSVVLHLQVANFNHRAGGLWIEINFGNKEQINKLGNSMLIKDAALLGLILIMSLYHFGLAAINRNKHAAFYFGLFTFILFIRIAVTGEFISGYFFNINWLWQIKIDYLSFVCAAIFSHLFIYTLFRSEYNNKVLYINIAILAIFSLMFLFFSAFFSTKILIFVQVFVLLSAFYVIYVLIRATINKKDGAVGLITGILFFLITFINDILFNNAIIRTTTLFPVGLLGLILSQAYVLSHRFNKAFIKVEKLSEELNFTNKNLEKIVEKRTSELRNKNEKLAATQKDLRKNNEELLTSQEHILVQHKHLKESEAKLLKSNKTKDKFFSIIAHDLKNPFNALIGFSDLLLKGHKKYDEGKRERMIKSINDTSKNAFKLLENLLTWSRSQSQNIKYLPKKLNLETLFFETVYQNQGMADKKNIQILYSISGNETIFADKSMINTIFRNLISNAIKFTHKHGTITISSAKHKSSNYLQISVKDTGVGVPPERLDNLFRLDKNTSTYGTENETGTGLGLILCKEFIEKHGGKIWVESELGKGSSFIFSIPTI